MAAAAPRGVARAHAPAAGGALPGGGGSLLQGGPSRGGGPSPGGARPRGGGPSPGWALPMGRKEPSPGGPFSGEQGGLSQGEEGAFSRGALLRGIGGLLQGVPPSRAPPVQAEGCEQSWMAEETPSPRPPPPFVLGLGERTARVRRERTETWLLVFGASRGFGEGRPPSGVTDGFLA